ncbi:MAG: NUDIX domain-containing protein [Polyangiaceae bacterium]
MPISPYLKQLRSRIGHEMVLMPSVAALVRNQAGQVLFQRRADDGLWSLPSGSIDPGETPGQAIVREVREETGLIVEPTRVAAVFGGSAYQLRYPNDDIVEYTVIVFECRTLGGELGGLDGESLELRYCSAADRPPLIAPFPEELFAPGGSPEVLFT